MMLLLVFLLLGCHSKPQIETLSSHTPETSELFTEAGECTDECDAQLTSSDADSVEGLEPYTATDGMVFPAHWL